MRKKRSLTLTSKATDPNIGMIPDASLAMALGMFGLGKDFTVLPFININGNPMMLIKRSETAKKAVILHKEKHYILKEIPWYCYGEMKGTEHITCRIKFQEKLRGHNLPIPSFMKTTTDITGKTNHAFISSLPINYSKQRKDFFLQEFVIGTSWEYNANNATKDIAAAKTLASMHKASKKIYERNYKINYFAYHFVEKDIFSGASDMIDILEKEASKRNLSETISRDLSRFLIKQRKTINTAQALAKNKGYYQLKYPVHGDYNPWNIVFSNDGCSVKAIIDFDNSVVDHPIHDIAEFILNYCFLVFRGESMRYCDTVPEGYHLEKACSLLLTYCSTYGSISEQILKQFTQASTVICIELFSLGLVRGDYSASKVNQLSRSVLTVQRESEQIANRVVNKLWRVERPDLANTFNHRLVQCSLFGAAILATSVLLTKTTKSSRAEITL